MAKKRVSAGRRRANRRTTVFVVIVAAVVAVALSVAGYLNLQKNHELEEEAKRIKESIALEESRSAAIDEKKDRNLTEEEMIEIARQKLGLLFPNEIVFIPEEQ